MVSQVTSQASALINFSLKNKHKNITTFWGFFDFKINLKKYYCLKMWSPKNETYLYLKMKPMSGTCRKTKSFKLVI